MAKINRGRTLDVDPARFELKAEALAANLRDAMLAEIRLMKTPWSLSTEQQQRDVVHRVEAFSAGLVTAVVNLVTHFEFPTVPVVLGEMKIKGEKGIEAKIGCLNHTEAREALGQHVGRAMLCLLVDPEFFMQETEPAHVDPDQPNLPV